MPLKLSELHILTETYILISVSGTSLLLVLDCEIHLLAESFLRPGNLVTLK